MKIDLPAGQQHNLYATLLSLVQGRTLHLHLVTVDGVLDTDLTTVARLEAVVKDPVRCKRISSKARARVVNFHQRNRGSGAILDRRVNMVRVTCDHRSHR